MSFRRIVAFVFSGQLLREMKCLLEIRKLNKNLIVFYCAGWIDEVYVRSSIDCCINLGLNVILITSDEERRETVPERSVKRYTLSARFLKHTKASIFVTSSTGIDPNCFPSHAHEIIHIPHSLVSMNLVYHPGAFDAFTRFFVCGQYQEDEIRELDLLAGREERYFHLMGYGKSDLMPTYCADWSIEKGLVMIAPSWGKDGFIETIAESTISALLKAGYRVCLRPHPRYMKKSVHLLENLTDVFSCNDNFVFENPMFISEMMDKAEILISDYSGAAFEYVFSKRRPAIFIDLPLKNNNPHFDNSTNVPVEIAWRHKVGLIVPPSPTHIVEAVSTLKKQKVEGDFAIDEIRQELRWDGRCGERIADWLKSIVNTKAVL